MHYSFILSAITNIFCDYNFTKIWRIALTYGNTNLNVVRQRYNGTVKAFEKLIYFYDCCMFMLSSIVFFTLLFKESIN